ncbi:PREDICTED: filamin-A-like, partial [Tinamus guttatus]|uniref:filamin-A-like n=1 Tax=Tinamus guttatus TaxID=94827 RepID=UPI00052E93FD
MATNRPLLGVNGLDMAGLRPFDLVIPFTIKKGEITGEVRMPSGKVAKPDITDNKDGTVTVRFAPSEAGLHEMDICYENPGALGCRRGFGSLLCHRYRRFWGVSGAPADPRAIPAGDDSLRLSHLKVGTSADIPLDIGETDLSQLTATVTSPSGRYGGLSLSIEGPSKVDINCEDMEDGTCKVSYCPTEPGNYIISVKFGDQHVP